MSLIERAAERLEALRRAGVNVPTTDRTAVPPTPVVAAEQARIDSRAPVTPVPSITATTAASPTYTTKKVELDFVRLAAKGFLTPDLPRSRVADEFRIVKRPILANATEGKPVPLHHANLVMVTSATPGEGKTFCAINLALSIASELNRTVLLVDADVARPSLPHLLGLPPGKGLLDVLEDPALPLSEVLIKTNVDKLTILPSGGPNTKSTELLASDAMIALLAEMSQRYADRVIVFDSPPLLATTEARVLANQMGQAVFVVRAESTLQADVKRALAMIEPCPVKLMLLNQTRTSSRAGYGYGYGYGYGA